jgi:hypothetical protein
MGLHSKATSSIAMQGIANHRNAQRRKPKQRGKHLATGVCRVSFGSRQRINPSCIATQGNSAQGI